jgi:hypothetical protein
MWAQGGKISLRRSVLGAVVAIFPATAASAAETEISDFVARAGALSVDSSRPE